MSICLRYLIFFNYLKMYKLQKYTQIVKMGSCVSSYRVMNNNKKVKSYEFSPTDINEYEPKSDNKFDFEGTLSNIKIENINPKLQKQSFSVGFTLHDILQASCLQSQVINNRIKWDLIQKFNFSLNAYELRARFLKVQIMGANKKILMGISINLYKIATGPFHYDLNLSKGNKSYGRLIFDFRLIEIAKIKIECIAHEAIFYREYPGQRFNFLLEVYKQQSKANDKKEQKNKRTEPSYINQVSLMKIQKFRHLQLIDKAPTPTTRQKRTASELIKQDTTTKVVWSEENNKPMPSIQINVKINQIMSTTLVVKIYRNPTQKISKEFGRSSIILSEIVSNNYSHNNKSKEDIIQRIQQVWKNIWHKGNKIGQCKIAFQITSYKILRQMVGKTQTQDGIIDMNHYQTYKMEKNSFTQLFFSNLQEIQKQVIQINQIKTKKQENATENPDKTQQIKKCMEKLKTTALGSGRSSSAYLTDNTRKLQKQTMLINILKMLCTIIAQQNSYLNKLCWENVVLILYRNQIKFKNWEFSQQQKTQMLNNQISPQLRNRIVQGAEFYNVLCELLKLAIHTTYLALDQQNQHSQIYKAFCYFKIPIFREKIIQRLQRGVKKLKSNDAFLQQFLQNTKPYEDKGSYAQLFTIVDYRTPFYQTVSCTQRGQQTNKDLQNFLQTNTWLDDISAKGDIFYDNMRYILKKFLSVKQATNTFNYFPGYTAMISAFLQCMKDTDLLDYSSSFILCMTNVVENDHLIYPMLKLLFKKTNLYSTSHLTKLLTVLCYFLHNIPKHVYNKLTMFPYKFLMDNLKQILQTEFVLNVGQTIIMLYNNYQNFHATFRYELSMYFLGKMLWKFIYHWSFNIRRVIYHFIILKIGQDIQLYLTTNIQDRLKQFYRILSNGQQLWKNYKIERIKNIIEKQQNLHTRMINKLKNNKNKNIHSYQQGQFCFQQMITDVQLEKSNIIVTNYNKDKDTGKEKDNNRYTQSTDSPQIKNMLLKKNNNNDFQQLKYDFTQNNSQFSSQSPQKLSSFLSKISINNNNNSPIDSMIQARKISLFYKKDDSKKLSIKQISTKIFKPQQLIISQYIPGLAYSYFEIAAKQFRQILKLVNQHYQKNKKLPVINLGLMIQVDSKQMMPCQNDFSLLF